MPQKKSTTEGEKKVLTKAGNFNCKCKLFEHQAKLLIKKKFSPPSPLSLSREFLTLASSEKNHFVY